MSTAALCFEPRAPQKRGRPADMHSCPAHAACSLDVRVLAGLDGVYIDQIAAAGPRPCFDPSHGHALGGGDHWVKGYGAMLDKVRGKAKRPHMILTESNAEPFMQGVQLFLTLVGFERGEPHFYPSLGSAETIVPAFQAIYGGYVLAVGAEFFREDLVPDPNVFASKIAAQFSFGAQMGWFSLGGRDNQDPPMGMFDLLMDPEYDAEITYLRTLSRAKQLAADWLNFGRAMRPLPIVLNQTQGRGGVRRTSHPRSSRDEHAPRGLAYGDVLGSTWLAADDSNLLITMTTIKRATPASVQCTIDARAYGFVAAAADDEFDVFYMAVGPSFATAWHQLGRYPAAAVKLDTALGVRAVVLLRIQPAVRSFHHT